MRCVLVCCHDWLQSAKYNVWNVLCVRFVWWLASSWTVKGLNCVVCQIGLMTGYRLHNIWFEPSCVSDWCDDRLQAGQYKVWNLVCVKYVWWLATDWTVEGLNCGVPQIGVMSGYRLDSITIETRCVTISCDDWLQGGQYNDWTAVCVRLVWWLVFSVVSITFEPRSVSDWCDDWLYIGH